jgi:hypothetical protein
MSENTTSTFPARVVEVIDPFKVVVNRGSSSVKKGQRLLIYAVGKELFDPDTNESLGRLEVVRGTGVVTHVQERLCTVTSDQRGSTTRRTIKRNDAFSIIQGRGDEVVEEPGKFQPFEEPAVGDHAKPV